MVWKQTEFLCGTVPERVSGGRSYTATVTNDWNGNITEVNEVISHGLNATSTFAYDYENRLTEFTIGGSGFSAEHTYDGFNRLVKTDATVGMTTTNYEHVYAGKKHLGNIDVTGTPVNGKVWRWEGGAGAVDNAPIEAPQRSTASGGSYYMVNDEKDMQRKSYRVASVTAGDYNDDSRYAEWQWVNGAIVPCRVSAAPNLSELFSAYAITLDADRASSAASNHALQLAATDLEYEVTRVKSPVLGRDLNPLGRGDGTYYCNGGNRGGCLAIYRAKPVFAGNVASGYGNDINNQEDGGSDCEKDYDEFLRLEAAGLCKRQVELMPGESCCELECAAERAGQRPISKECMCCGCKGCGPCSVPDPCCCCPEDDEGREQQQQSCQNCMPYGPNEPGCPNPWAPEIPPVTPWTPGGTIVIRCILARMQMKVQDESGSRGVGVPVKAVNAIENAARQWWNDIKLVFNYCRRKVCCEECMGVNTRMIFDAIGSAVIACGCIFMFALVVTLAGASALATWLTGFTGVGLLVATLVTIALGMILTSIIGWITDLWGRLMYLKHVFDETWEGGECLWCIIKCMFGLSRNTLAGFCATTGVAVGTSLYGGPAVKIAVAEVRRGALRLAENLALQGLRKAA